MIHLQSTYFVWKLVRFPYFLPCLCTSIFAAVVLISCIWMPVCGIAFVYSLTISIPFEPNFDSSPAHLKPSHNVSQETLHKHKVHENRSQNIEALEAHLIDSKEKVEESGSLDTKKSLFRNWPLMSSIIVYCIFSFHDMAYTEVFAFCLLIMTLKFLNF